VDAFSANYLRGAVVDFFRRVDRRRFQDQQPNAAQSCGCGKSFATEQTPPGHA